MVSKFLQKAGIDFVQNGNFFNKNLDQFNFEVLKKLQHRSSKKILLKALFQ